MKHLVVSGRELNALPSAALRKAAKTLEIIDASHNKITILDDLDVCVKLGTLVLDDNGLTSSTVIPPCPSLTALSVNKNRIENLSAFVDALRRSTPNLRFLSMLMNDACPNFFNGGTPKQYKDYRLFVISRLPALTQLDSTPVTEEERSESAAIYGNLPVRR